MSLTTTVLAFGWAPEIRGILFVLIAVVLLCGSIYLLLATNLGARLGFLVAVAALFGWIFLLAGVWWSYGIGLQGALPTWSGQEIVVGDLTNASTAVVAGSNDLTQEGFTKLAEDNPGFGQAVASADEILTQEAKKFQSNAEYKVAAVYDKNGGSFPKVGAFDYFAFFHRPHWAVVEVRPVIPQQTEPGRAPPPPIIDESQPPIYVVMLRNLGTQRLPAALITMGVGIIFALTLYLMHRREKLVNQHLAGTEVEKVSAGR